MTLVVYHRQVPYVIHFFSTLAFVILILIALFKLIYIYAYNKAYLLQIPTLNNQTFINIPINYLF
jgi:hypothetical protein